MAKKKYDYSKKQQNARRNRELREQRKKEAKRKKTISSILSILIVFTLLFGGMKLYQSGAIHRLLQGNQLEPEDVKQSFVMFYADYDVEKESKARIYEKDIMENTLVVINDHMVVEDHFKEVAILDVTDHLQKDGNPDGDWWLLDIDSCVNGCDIHGQQVFLSHISEKEEEQDYEVYDSEAIFDDWDDE